MGSDLLEQIENFNLLELAVLCEKEKHKDIGKTSQPNKNKISSNELKKLSKLLINSNF